MYFENQTLNSLNLIVINDCNSPIFFMKLKILIIFISKTMLNINKIIFFQKPFDNWEDIAQTELETLKMQ